MTGHNMGGGGIGQREKIHALLRSSDEYMGTMEILYACHNSRDEKLKTIRIESIRRCLQELLKADKVVKNSHTENPTWLGRA